jgi:group I intron endonuclease
MLGCLYCVTSPSGKKYIGISSKTAEDRWKKHVSNKKDNCALHFAIRKYGSKTFELKTLLISDNWDYLCLMEQKAIISFNTKSPNGYNITDGGEGVIGRIVTDETKAKMSIGQKKRFKDPAQKAKNKENGKLGSVRNMERCAALRIDGKPKWIRELEESRCRNGSAEHKAKVSKATKAAMARPEVKKKLYAAARERSLDSEWRAKISKTSKGRGLGRTLPPEQIEKMREARKMYWVKRKEREANEVIPNKKLTLKE